MEILYLILLFLAPGLFVKVCTNVFSLIERKKNKKETVYEQLFGVVVNSLVISSVQILIYNLVYKYQFKSNSVETLTGLFGKFDNFIFLIIYVFVCLLLSFLYMLLLEKCIKKRFYNFESNKAEKLGLKFMNDNKGTVWQAMMYKKEIIDGVPRQNTIVAIYHHDAYVTAGVINGFNTKEEEGNEFKLIRVQEIDRIMREDEEKCYEDKIGYPQFEFYNTDTGLRIRFFKPGRFVKRINEHREERNN